MLRDTVNADYKGRGTPTVCPSLVVASIAIFGLDIDCFLRMWYVWGFSNWQYECACYFDIPPFATHGYFLWRACCHRPTLTSLVDQMFTK